MRALGNPVTQRDWDGAHLIEAAREIHDDDPSFRLLVTSVTSLLSRAPSEPQPASGLCTISRLCRFIPANAD